MGRGRGRTCFLGTAGAAVLIVGGGLFALRGVLVELWVIHFELMAGDDGPQRKVLESETDPVESRQRAAIRWLAGRRSVVAAPYLLEIAGPQRRKVSEREQPEISIEEEAERALRDLPLEDDWYLGRGRTGSEGSRRLASGSWETWAAAKPLRASRPWPRRTMVFWGWKRRAPSPASGRGWNWRRFLTPRPDREGSPVSG